MCNLQGYRSGSIYCLYLAPVLLLRVRMDGCKIGVKPDERGRVLAFSWDELVVAVQLAHRGAEEWSINHELRTRLDTPRAKHEATWLNLLWPFRDSIELAFFIQGCFIQLFSPFQLFLVALPFRLENDNYDDEYHDKKNDKEGDAYNRGYKAKFEKPRGRALSVPVS